MKKIATLAAMVLLSAAVAAQQNRVDDHLSRARELYQLGCYKQAHLAIGKARAAAQSLYENDAVEMAEIELVEALCVAAEGNNPKKLAAWVERYPLSPLSAEALFALGTEYFEQQNWARVVECYARVEQKRLSNEQMEQLCFEMGYAAYKTAQTELAAEWLARVDKQSTYFPHAKYTLGYMAYEQGNLAAAKHQFSVIAQNDDYRQVVAYYLLNIEHRQGNNAYVADNAEAVLKYLKGPRRAEVLKIAAQSAFGLHRWQQAEAYIAQLINNEAAKADREENYIGGYSLYRLGQHREAADYLRKVCGPDDDLTQNAAYHLADCYLHTNNKKGAMQAFAMAYGSGSDKQTTEDALYNYCKLQVELDDSNFDEEIHLLSSYIDTYPQSVHRREMERYLVMVCYDAKDLKMAYETLDKYSESGSGEIRAAMQKIAYYYAAECYATAQLDQAEEYCNLSLDLREYNRRLEAKATFLLGEINYATGHLKLAASMFDRYIDMGFASEHDYPFAYYNLGYARFNISRYEASYDDFADFVELYGGEDMHFVADAYNRLGDVECAAKAYKAAAEMYRKAAAIEAEPECYYGAYRAAMMEGLAGNHSKRVEELKQIVQQGKGPYVQRAHYEMGHTLITTSQYEQGAQVLEAYVKRYERKNSQDYVAALADLGLAYRNMAQDNKALDTYKRIVAYAKGSVAAYNAMEEIRNISVEQNRVGDYFDYAAKMGMASDNQALQRDSLSFVAAQRLYIAGNKPQAATAFDGYIADHPEGAYSAAARYYAADCHIAQGNTQQAEEYLSTLVGMYYNPYTQRAYERLAQIQLDSNNLEGAAEAYRKLAEVATDPVVREEALANYLNVVVRQAVDEDVVAAADVVLGTEGTSVALQRTAKLHKALALENLGRRNPAVAIYSSLSEDVSDQAGAQSAYKMIQTAFQYGSFEKAESLVYEFAAKNTPHALWLAKAFMLLGDVYVSRGDLFQARATYQSIVDGFSATDSEGEEIINQARTKIAEIGLNV